ncbi:MAG: transposase [Verrucomicrobiae bacterium]|nr:transposase [Verrucomicrobiae bacterium]
MSRRLRFEYPGAIYHVINRGNYRSWIFETEGARQAFEKALWETCSSAGWILHAWVVMGNHFHLALETSVPNLSEGMRQLQSKFAFRFNRFRKESGRLFQGRFKSIVIEDFDRLAWLCHYIHLNPVRAKICAVDSLKSYRHGSYWYLRHPRKRPGFFNPLTCLQGAGNLKDTSHGRNQYESYLDWLQEDQSSQKSMNFDKMSKGWALGAKSFKKDLLKDEKRAVAALKLGVNEAREARELAWESRLEACLEFLGKTDNDISRDPKSAPWKASIAAHLKTTMLCRNDWIGQRLNMGTVSGVSRLAAAAAQGKLSATKPDLKRLNTRFKE